MDSPSVQGAAFRTPCSCSRRNGLLSFMVVADIEIIALISASKEKCLITMLQSFYSTCRFHLNIAWIIIRTIPVVLEVKLDICCSMNEPDIYAMNYI